MTSGMGKSDRWLSDVASVARPRSRHNFMVGLELHKERMLQPDYASCSGPSNLHGMVAETNGPASTAGLPCGQCNQLPGSCSG